jgi:hypothetical protein
MSIYSRVQVEIALFNDRILAWEPLIEPIIDERGEIISPWSITCSTMIVSPTRIFLLSESNGFFVFRLYYRKMMKMKTR